MGKTTTAVNLGAGLARAGYSTLIVDLDPQGNATSGVGVPEENRIPGVYEMLRGEIQPLEAVKLTTQERYSVIPATADLAGASVELMGVNDRESRLKNSLIPLKEHFQYIIVDAPPSLGILTMNALVAAEKVLIPVQCEYYALEGLGQLLQTIGLVKEHLHPQLDILGAVLTLFDRRVRVSHDVIREVREHFPGHVFETVIPRNIRLAEAPSYGKNIFEYDDESLGAQMYNKFAEEVHIMSNKTINQPIQQI